MTRARMTGEQRGRLDALPYGKAFSTDEALDLIESEVKKRGRKSKSRNTSKRRRRRMRRRIKRRQSKESNFRSQRWWW